MAAVAGSLRSLAQGVPSARYRTTARWSKPGSILAEAGVPLLISSRQMARGRGDRADYRP